MTGRYSSIILLTIWGLGKSNAENLASDLPVYDYQSMDHGEAVKFLQLSEINSLKKRVNDLEKEQEKLIQNNLENMDNLKKEKDEMEKDLTEKLKKSQHSCTNKNILVKFMRNILYHKNKKSSVCVKTIETLTEKMKLQGDLLEEYKELIAIQDASLKSLKPTLSYVVQNNSQFQYKTEPDGTLMELVPCKCLPVTRDPAITFTSIHMNCPSGSVVVDTLLPSKELDCPGGECPFEIEETVCGDYSELPWTEWDACTGDYCLYDNYRERKYLDAKGQIVSKVEGDGARPLVFNETESFDVVLPAGQLGVFVVGGGGGADDTESGSSGFFTYQTLDIKSSGTYQVSVLVGKGGFGDGRGGPIDGVPTVVDVIGVGKVEAAGGGGRGMKGWSGGSSEHGGFNGESGQDKDNGSFEPLPDICGDLVDLSAGPTGRYDNDGTGGGGVIVNGMQPVQVHYRDGHGYGAGGGEDDHSGYDGVAVLVLCNPVTGHPPPPPLPYPPPPPYPYPPPPSHALPPLPPPPSRG